MKLTKLNATNGTYVYNCKEHNVFLIENNYSNCYNLRNLKDDETYVTTKERADREDWTLSLVNMIISQYCTNMIGSDYGTIDNQYIKLLNGVDRFWEDELLYVTNSPVNYTSKIENDIKNPFKVIDNLLKSKFMDKDEIKIYISLYEFENEFAGVIFSLKKISNDDGLLYYLISINKNITEAVDFYVSNFKFVSAFLNHTLKSRVYYTGLFDTLYTKYSQYMNMSTIEDISDYLESDPKYDYALILFAHLGFLKYDKKSGTLTGKSDLPSFLKLDEEHKTINLERTTLALLDDFGDIVFPEKLNDGNVPLFVADVDNFRDYIDMVTYSKCDFVNYER